MSTFEQLRTAPPTRFRFSTFQDFATEEAKKSHTFMWTQLIFPHRIHNGAVRAREVMRFIYLWMKNHSRKQLWKYEHGVALEAGKGRTNATTTTINNNDGKTVVVGKKEKFRAFFRFNFRTLTGTAVLVPFQVKQRSTATPICTPTQTYTQTHTYVQIHTEPHWTVHKAHDLRILDEGAWWN